MKKKYMLEFLYDSGVVEQFETREGTLEEVKQLTDTIKQTLKNNLAGTITMKDADGNEASINIQKICRLTVK